MLHLAGRSDVSKTSKPGNFQVLNWERNSLSPTSNGGRNPTNVARVPSTPSGVSLPPKGSLNLNCSSDTFGDPEKLDPEEEEVSFLRSLGWEEDAGEEALTREEIESFLSVVIFSP
ncbi:hypothetical protein KSP39_PZI020665 [Platanthera zijinensis]|uniref:Uncharacterized protein n=1 Tax=Platanthera zijinensis TaxID=2320716 RepID=A0AAP0FXB6_9ASPA